MSRHPTYQFRLDRPAPWTRTNQVYYKKMKSGIRLMHDAVVLLLKDWQDYERVIWAFVCYQYFLGKSDEIQYLRTEFHGLEYLRSIVEHLRELREMMEEANPALKDDHTPNRPSPQVRRHLYTFCIYRLLTEALAQAECPSDFLATEEVHNAWCTTYLEFAWLHHYVSYWRRYLKKMQAFKSWMEVLEAFNTWLEIAEESEMKVRWPDHRDDSWNKKANEIRTAGLQYDRD